MRGKIVCLYGPTASNKSAIAIEIANSIPAVIINADSTQLYKHVEILTAQPENLNSGNVAHKLYRFIEIHNNLFSVKNWLEHACKAINIALDNEQTAIIVGGTGLYFFTLINGLTLIPEITRGVKSEVQCLGKKHGNFYDALSHYDRELARRLNKNDKVRIIRGLEVKISTGKSILDWQRNTQPFFPDKLFKTIYMNLDRTVIYSNIEKRFSCMLKNGVIDEVKSVVRKYSINNLPKIIGLSTINNYLRNHCSYSEMISETQQLSRNYAKRQCTWFNNKFQHHHVINSLQKKLLTSS